MCCLCEAMAVLIGVSPLYSRVTGKDEGELGQSYEGSHHLRCNVQCHIRDSIASEN